MPCILTLLLAKRVGPPVPENADDDAVLEIIKGQFAVRQFASLLLQHIIDSFGSSYSTLKPRVTRTFLRALLDSSKPLGTHYGALLGIEKLGTEVIRLVLVGNVKMWYKQVIENDKKRPVETNILKEKVIEVLEKLKIEDTPLKDASAMDVDSQDPSDTVKENLKERIGEPLANDLLKRPDAKSICRGIFIGEANIEI